MKTIKPQKLSILCRTFEAAGSLDLCVTVMLASPFDAPESPLHEATLWKMLAAELGPDVAPDLGMPKPRAEVLVLGLAPPRGGERLRIGPIDKTLPEDGPEAAGFGPLDVTAPERAAKAGTYDDAWRKEQSPAPPLDFDFAFYNTAPLDQRLDEPFAGGEAFTLENVHPEKPILEGRLPRFRARIFVNLRGGELREVPMRLETVQLFPGAGRMLILFRGVTGVTEDDASDVLELVAACEELGAPRPVEHYQAVLAERLDRKRGALASLRDSDLMPPGPAAKVSADELGDPHLAAPLEHLKRQNMRRKTAREIEAARARIKAAGLDPDEHLPAAAPPEPDRPGLDEIEGLVAKAKEDGARLRAEASEKRAEAEAEARERCRAAGLDYDERRAEAQPSHGGPPQFSAAAEMQKLRDRLARARRAGTPLPALEAQVADTELHKKLEATEDRLRDLYRKHAHRLPAAPPAAAPLTERARTELPAGAQEGVSFAGRDLTGADLSGLDLH
jgi:hypothetical protein